MGIFLDLIHLSPEQTDRAIGYILKAVHDHDDDGDEPHDSPFIRRLIQLFMDRGLQRIDAVQSELSKWQAGKYHAKGTEVPPRPPGAMVRWSEAELDLVRIYLRALPPEAWTLADHMMLVDFLFQRYLPADDLRTEAEWMATRSSLMGKVQANLDHEPSLKQADVILAALPNTAAQAAEQFLLSPMQQAVLEIGQAKAAEYVTRFSDEARARLRAVIMKDAEQKMLAVRGVPDSALQTKLFDTFAAMNRDWQRIAVTQAGNNALVGFIASLKPGTKVRRVERYVNVCPNCRRIDGKVMTVVDPADPNKNPDTDIWVGKDNFGRSASPKKRVGDELVDRTPDEMWWIPAGLMHPNCRGRWVLAEPDAHPGDDPEFAAWLRELLDPNKETP